jgi:ricin-type beta-trefoil lectin protein/putative Ig domain-containing protein
MRKTLLAAATAAAAVTAGVVMASTAGAATNLSVTLSASGSGASAVYNSAGQPVLTVGAAGTTAEIVIDSPPSTAPTTAPTFTSSNYTNGSPRWLIQFSGGDELAGYPTNSGLGTNNWQVIPSSDACGSLTDATYTSALTFIQGNDGCGGNVTAAEIIASGSQAPNSSDVITGVLYNGETLAPGTTTDVVTVTAPASQTSTVGTAISTLQISASSNKGEAITSYTATGLPPGLVISTTGAITGTPTTAGTYTVTVTVTDAIGTQGVATFTWTVSSSGTTGSATYSGNIRLIKMNYCLDDRNNSSTAGAVVQIWRCNGLTNQVWQVMSNGTIQHNGLCLDAQHNGTSNGTRLQLWTCTGGNNQLWSTSGWRIHYNNPNSSGKVVDDTAFGGSGTPQELWTNNGGTNQVWATS